MSHEFVAAAVLVWCFWFAAGKPMPPWFYVGSAKF